MKGFIESLKRGAEVVFGFVATVLIVGFMFLIMIRSVDKSNHYWYPVKLAEATCSNFKGEVFLMENSIGWRSWPYWLNKDTKQEIQMPEDCVFNFTKTYPDDVKNLTYEQVKYTVKGF